MSNKLQEAPFKLLISSRDVGAATTISGIISKALCDPRFELKIIAAQPAFKFLKKAGYEVTRHNGTFASNINSSQAALLLKQADQILNSFRPDAVLTGLSGPNGGIDEALLARAETSRTYAVQDFWGDVNLTFGQPAGTYFVLDSFAEHLTKSRVPSRIVVSGSAKYESYKELDISNLRRAFRKKFYIEPNQKVIGFFDSMLWDIPGYEKTLITLVETLRTRYSHYPVFYRAHPGMTPDRQKKALQYFRRDRLNILEDPEAPVESVLAGCDIVLSCFSSCGYDFAVLNRFSDKPLGVPIYLMFEEGISKWLSKHSGLTTLPPVTNGLALKVKTSLELPVTLEKAFQQSTQVAIWEQGKKTIPDPQNASKMVLDTIALDLNSNM